MFFQRVLTAGLIFLFMSPAYAEQTEFAQRLALAEEVVSISQADQLMEQMTLGLQDAQAQALDLMLQDTTLSDRQREQLIEDVSEIIVEELAPAISEFTKKMAPLLADVYTLAELQGLLEFYNSPTGQAMLAKQPILMEKSMTIAQEWNTRNLQDVMQRMQPRIQEVVEDAMKGI